MKAYKCDKLPNGLEFGAVALADSEYEAKQKIKLMAEKEGWEVNLDKIEVEEINDVAPVDPMNTF